MKITHICCVYIDGWGYQDNLLPHYHSLLGHDVVVLTPNGLPKYITQKTNKKKEYYINRVKIIRYKSLFYITMNFFFPLNFYKNLKKEKPDIIFHHDVNFTTLILCSIYKLFNKKCVLFVDNHADEINCSQNPLWRFLYYDFLLRLVCYFSSPLIHKYYGVANSRVEFLHKHFGIDNSKIDLLPIGADMEMVNKVVNSVDTLKAKYQIPLDAFVVVTGGKMGKDKGTNTLIKVIDDLNKQNYKITLILFGSISDKETTDFAKATTNVFLLGWRDRIETIEILKLANVAVWPIHHTTLIEDAVATSTPLIIRKTKTTEHLIDGNGIPLITGDYYELRAAIKRLYNGEFCTSLQEDCVKMKNKINYFNIAQKIIDDAN